MPDPISCKGLTRFDWQNGKLPKVRCISPQALQGRLKLLYIGPRCDGVLDHQAAFHPIPSGGTGTSQLVPCVTGPQLVGFLSSQNRPSNRRQNV